MILTFPYSGQPILYCFLVDVLCKNIIGMNKYYIVMFTEDYNPIHVTMSRASALYAKTTENLKFTHVNNVTCFFTS